jgi:hypothetical protein
MTDTELRAALAPIVGSWLFSVLWLASGLFCWIAFELPGGQRDWSTVYVTALAVLLLGIGLASSVVTAVLASRVVPRHVAAAIAGLPIMAVAWLAVGVV